MSFFRTLRIKLFYIFVFAAAISILPCYMVVDGHLSRLKASKKQREAVRLLSCLADFSNGMYSRDNSIADVSKTSLQSAISDLCSHYEMQAQSSVRVRSLFSKQAFANMQKSMRPGAISDMAGVIVEKNLFSDYHSGMGLLMEVSGSYIPSIMSDLFLFRSSMARADDQPKVSAAVPIFTRISIQIRSMIYKFGLSASDNSYKISSQIYEKTNRLSAQLIRAEKLAAQSGQSNDARSGLIDAVDSIERQIFDIWTSSNKDLLTLLEKKISAEDADLRMFILVFCAVFACALALCLFIAHSVLAGMSKISETLNLASMGNMKGAREACDRNSSSFAEFGDMGECVLTIVTYMGELVDNTRKIAETSNRINLMLNSMNATKMSLLVSIKDAFAEANKQIQADYEFVSSEAKKLGDCSGKIIDIERSLKNTRKYGGLLRENITSVAGISADLSKGLSECRNILDKLSSFASSLNDSAKRINLLGLDLSVIARRLGESSEGADTLASQIRMVSRQVGVLVVDVDSLRTQMANIVSQGLAGSAKIGEVAESSKLTSEEIDSLSNESYSGISSLSVQISSIASSLKSNISSGFSYEASVQDIDDIKESIKDISSIVKKSSDSVDALRIKIRELR